MRGAWERLCAESSKHLLSQTADRDFEILAGRQGALAGFASPGQVVEYQHCRDPTHDEHDRVGHALIVEYQRGSDRARELAGAILFLSMSPGLLYVFRRVLPLHDSEADAASDVCLSFFEQVRKWRPEKTDRVAVNLQRNTLRSVVEARKRVARVQRLFSATPIEWVLAENDDERDAPESEWLLADLLPSTKSRADVYEPDDLEIEWLEGVLVRAPGISRDDAVLFALRVPCALSWEEIGERLDVKPETLRKRYRKLAERLPSQEFLERHVPGFKVDPRI